MRIDGLATSGSPLSARSSLLSAACFVPPILASVYPVLLAAFHRMVGPPGFLPGPWRIAGSAVLLIAMFAVPAIGLMCAARREQPSAIRRLAYASVVAPTAYVFLGVLQSMAHSPLPDPVVWCALWAAATAWAVITATGERGRSVPVSPSDWRVAHGIVGATVLTYVMFHVFNHLFGLIGPEAHAAVMAAGRKIYRAPLIQPLLVLALLFQIISGLRLAWRWSVAPVDFHRLFQVASGFYLSVFVLGHMNSVFIYARTYLGIPTDWNFATGAPSGLIHDAWNIRLVPHYALGVLFVLTHLASGLRVVLIAHGTAETTANRFWAAGAAASVVVVVAIMLGMCGVRIAAA